MVNRLFFALWPDDRTRADLHTAAKSVLMKHPPGGRPIEARNLHLTLRFLGNDNTPAEEAAIRQAAALVRQAPFSFQLDVASSFKEKSAWWLGSREPSRDLAELQQQIKNRRFGAKVGHDAKRFVPHVTILHTAPRLLPPSQIKPIEWLVSDFVLVRSTLGTAHPLYEVLERWPLVAPEKAAEQLSLI